MIPRYARPEMAALWTDQRRWETILAVEDDGTPRLSSYRRVVLRVKAAPTRP